jgi:regulator of protease activity HflC (stomatin/prohibitin superfamily)
MSSAAEDLRDVGPWGQSVALAFRFLFLGACLIAAGWFVSNFRQIPPDSQAVVMRFGTVARIHGPGLLMAWPRPIEQITLLPAPARQIQLAVRRFDEESSLYDDSSSAGDLVSRSQFLSDDARLNTGFLLTGDFSVVHITARLFYQIADPALYRVAIDHVEPALERLFIASAVSITAGRDLDSILVARPEIASRAGEAEQRERLRTDLLDAVNRRLDALTAEGAGLGVSVSRIDLVPDLPYAAKSSFDTVLVVTQNAETAVAGARTRAQLLSQEADAKRDRIATSASAAAEERVADARTQTASIAALAQESKDMSRSMQLSRLYYDRVKPLLRKAGGVEVLDRNGTVHTILPEGAPR